VYVTVGTAMLLLEGGAGFISRLTLCLYLFLPSTRTVRRNAEKFNISDSTFHSLENTHFSIVKLLEAVHMPDYLSERVVVYCTRNTRPFSNIQ